MSDLDLLRDVGLLVQPPDFEELLATRRRRTQRTRIATASALVVAATVAAGALALTSNDGRGDPKPVGPTPTPTETKTVEVPAGQQTITPDIGPGDVHGFDELATVTNTQPEHVGETYLSTTVTAHEDMESVVYDCRAHDVPTWVAYADGDLVADSPGGAADGWTFRPCSSTEPLSFEIDANLPESSFRLGLEQKTVRMFAMAPPSPELRACLAADAPEGCPIVPDPIAATDAEFGFRIYEHRPAPNVLTLLKDSGNGEPYFFEALSAVGGTAWLVDRAVVAGPNADHLTLELPASGKERLVDVYVGLGPDLERCRRQHKDDLPDFLTTDHLVYEAAFDKICGADVRLVVDGEAVRPDNDPWAHGHFMELGALLAPGVDHQVVVEVVRGEPRNLQYAVVVRVPSRLP